MSTEPQSPAPAIAIPAEIPPSLRADYAAWAEKQREAQERQKAQQDDKPSLEQIMAQFKQLAEQLPEKVELPFHLTPEGDRMERFRRMCPPEFIQGCKRSLLRDPVAYDRVCGWDGSFPGPIATGTTGCRKTGAAWATLGRLYVRENRRFAWFPVKRLITEFEQFEAKNLADEFFRNYSTSKFNVLFVDDLDKINWQFESHKAALFQFYDWIYRDHVPCITTTNKDRAWWADRMGDAFARRIFDDAHFAVTFEAPKTK